MSDDLIARLFRGSSIRLDDIEYLKTACRAKPRMVPARQILFRQGDTLRSIPFVVRGWICASKHLEDGRWQMLSIFITGDLCNFGLSQLREIDCSLRTITDSIVLDFAHDELEALSVANPRLGQVLQSFSILQSAISREWMFSLGQRNAKERCAHLICELFWRLRAVGQAQNGTIPFPLTQEEIGAAMGITTVHVNRIMGDLRSDRLIEQDGRQLTILDLRRLENLALFNPSFLQLDANGGSIGEVGSDLFADSLMLNRS